MVCLPKFFDGSRVMPEVLLATNEEDGYATAKVFDLDDPLRTS